MSGQAVRHATNLTRAHAIGRPRDGEGGRAGPPNPSAGKVKVDDRCGQIGALAPGEQGDDAVGGDPLVVKSPDHRWRQPGRAGNRPDVMPRSQPFPEIGRHRYALRQKGRVMAVLVMAMQQRAGQQPRRAAGLQRQTQISLYRHPRIGQQHQPRARLPRRFHPVQQHRLRHYAAPHQQDRRGAINILIGCGHDILAERPDVRRAAPVAPRRMDMRDPKKPFISLFAT